MKLDKCPPCPFKGKDDVTAKGLGEYYEAVRKWYSDGIYELSKFKISTKPFNDAFDGFKKTYQNVKESMTDK